MKTDSIEYLQQQEANVRLMITAVSKMTGDPADRVSAVLLTGIMMSLRLRYDPTGLRLWLGDACRDAPSQAEVTSYWLKLGGS